MTAPEFNSKRSGDSRKPADDRVLRLDGVRGILAVVVVVYHTAFAAGVSSFILQRGDGFWGFLVDSLTVCVPPFLILSGLLLYRSYARATFTGTPGPTPGSFIWRRGLRILPAYWVMTIAVLFVINGNDVHTAWDVLRPLLLLQFFWPNGPFMALEHTWTIPADVAFYLVLPVLAWLINRYARKAPTVEGKARRMILPIVLFGLIGIGYTIYMFLPSMLPQAGLLSWWPPRYTGYYAIGMAMGAISAYVEVTGKQPAVYRVLTRHPNLCWLGAVGLALVNGWTRIGNYADIDKQLAWYLLVGVFGILLIGPVAVPGVQSRVLDAIAKNRPIRFIGRISYGIYLWHLFFVYLWIRDASVFRHTLVDDTTLRGTVSFWPSFAFVFGCSVAVAALSHYLLERPAMRLKRLVPGRPATFRPVPVPTPAVEEAERKAA
jgi:peptidoglycan/LPS O-acetylase OafA/YrhL